MSYNRNVEFIINLVVLLLIGSLVVSIIPVFFSLFVVLAVAYGIFLFVRYVIFKIDQKNAPQYDNEGRRITKISIVEMKDSDDSEDD